MKGWITPAEAEERQPGFFASRGEATWRWNADTSTLESKFGFVQIRVAVNGEHEGVNYRTAVAGHALLVWLCRHPEAL